MKLPQGAANHLSNTHNQYIQEPPIDHISFSALLNGSLEMQSAGGVGAIPLRGDTSAMKKFVYAVGSIQAQFPSLSVEKEFYQAADITDLTSSPSQQLLYTILSRVENQYIAREMCWVFQVGSVALYIIKPSSEQELSSLIRAIAPRPQIDMDVVIGSVGPVSRPEECNGLELPTILLNRAFDFTFYQMVNDIVKEIGIPASQAEVLFSHMLELSNNTGSSDRDRAVNYVTLEYMENYRIAAKMMYQGASQSPPDKEGFSLSGIRVAPSDITGNQKIMDVIFSYSGNSTTARQDWFCKVDVTGIYPFLIHGMVKYYARI